jgi:hypothetical protein
MTVRVTAGTTSWLAGPSDIGIVSCENRRPLSNSRPISMLALFCYVYVISVRAADPKSSPQNAKTEDNPQEDPDSLSGAGGDSSSSTTGWKQASQRIAGSGGNVRGPNQAAQRGQQEGRFDQAQGGCPGRGDCGLALGFGRWLATAFPEAPTYRMKTATTKAMDTVRRGSEC